MTPAEHQAQSSSHPETTNASIASDANPLSVDAATSDAAEQVVTGAGVAGTH